MEEDIIIPIVGMLSVFGWIPLTIYLRHKFRMEELRTRRQGEADQTTLHALQEIRRDVAALRDTTTKFDMSFDATLSRMEDRVDRLEERTAAAVGLRPDVETPAVQRNGSAGKA